MKSKLLLTGTLCALSILVLPNAAKAGDICREYTKAIYIDGRFEIGHGTACRDYDGRWESVRFDPPRPHHYSPPPPPPVHYVSYNSYYGYGDRHAEYNKKKHKNCHHGRGRGHGHGHGHDDWRNDWDDDRYDHWDDD